MKPLLGRLGARMKEVRTRRGWTQEHLVEQTEISPRYLSRLEGGRQSPSLDTWANLTQALEAELWELFDFGHAGTAKE